MIVLHEEDGINDDDDDDDDDDTVATGLTYLKGLA